MSTSQQTELLEGFEIVASDSMPAITLDNQRRFYLSTSARRLVNALPYKRLSIAYNPQDREVAIIDPRGIKQPSADYQTSLYNVDKRYYMSARHFAKNYGYEPSEAPYTFVYDRGASDGSIFIFRLTE